MSFFANFYFHMQDATQDYKLYFVVMLIESLLSQNNPSAF